MKINLSAGDISAEELLILHPAAALVRPDSLISTIPLQHLLRDILLVGSGGFAGSVCRYLISWAMMAGGTSAAFPAATFTVNAAGSLLIGMVMSLTGNQAVSLLLATGFCGGFTTFSTFSGETLALMKGGQVWAGVGYAALSVVVCVAMVMLGMWSGGKLKGI